MQKYWLPFRNVESLDESNFRKDVDDTQDGFANLSNVRKRQSTISEDGEPIRKKFQLNGSLIQASTSTNQLQKCLIIKDNTISSNGIKKPQATSFRHSESLGSTGKDVRNNQPGFLPASAKNIDCPPTLVEEPSRKKIQISNGTETNLTKKDFVKNVVAKNIIHVKSQPNSTNTMRCLTGTVVQILKFAKDFPNVNALYEVYAKVFKIDDSKVGQKIVLLKNNTGGPIIQGVHYEHERKMPQIKTGDSVRCVGRYENNSRLKIFKISLLTEDGLQVVARLHSIGSFVISQNENAIRAKNSKSNF